MKKAKEILGVLCGACGFLKVLSKNEDAWGHTFVAAVCALCTIAGGVATVDSLNKAYKAGKATAKAVNVATDLTNFTIDIC